MLKYKRKAWAGSEIGEEVPAREVAAHTVSLLGKAGLRESLPVSSAISCSDKTESKEEDRISVQNRRANILKSSRGHEKVKKPGLFTVLIKKFSKHKAGAFLVLSASSQWIS